MEEERVAPRRAPVEPVAGVLAGCIGGALYLLAQMVFAATVHGGRGWEPLDRISAMLLGEQFLPVDGSVNLTIGGFALLIHFALALTFGRLVDVVVRDAPLPRAVLAGAVLGVALYALAYWVVAPVAFPWFDDARGVTTLLDHVLFGGVTGAAYALLRRRHAPALAPAAQAPA